MQCCITELRSKDVINKRTGARLGNVVDCQVDTCTGCLVALVVVGRPRVMGFFQREEYFVRWEDIEVIGDDIILVNYTHNAAEPRRRGTTVEGFFR
ncbi:MAG: YlmC/YmxH family sporulation protein [Oscillospiraceae bacterium]|jgi:YlmC/YmxH family sporulation protein|nr:YlmC/YmxH family sporulation protein [Oscillospiraceae bacterium]